MMLSQSAKKYRPTLDPLESRQVLSRLGMGALARAELAMVAETRARPPAEVRPAQLTAPAFIRGRLAPPAVARPSAAPGAAAAVHTGFLTGLGFAPQQIRPSVVVTQNTGSSVNGGVSNVPAFNPVYSLGHTNTTISWLTSDNGLGVPPAGPNLAMNPTGVDQTANDLAMPGVTPATTGSFQAPGVGFGYNNGFLADDGNGIPYSFYNGLGVDTGVGFSNGIAFYNGLGFFNGLGSNNGFGFINGFGNPFVYNNGIGDLAPTRSGSTAGALR
jgi:hypothetical protein